MKNLNPCDFGLGFARVQLFWVRPQRSSETHCESVYTQEELSVDNPAVLKFILEFMAL